LKCCFHSLFTLCADWKMSLQEGFHSWEQIIELESTETGSPLLLFLVRHPCSKRNWWAGLLSWWNNQFPYS
jgi:hypothetical protein